ncbi:MAG TPA: discoidin domain-containing protein [Sedimentisphaerales bacterium]|nr:discoidin domain-containing protein [Sedimentisphaerales bacterium]
MFRRLLCLVSFGLVLGLMGAAEAAFDTVGVYDPDDAPHHNQVDQSGAYDSHTGNAGPENVIDLATFQELIGPAFAADAGGVVSGESPDDSLGSDDIVIANFGVNRTKSVSFASISGNLAFGSGASDGNRLPTSGNRRFAKSNTGEFAFDISPVAGGALGEVITYFAGTLLYRDNRDMDPQVTATFSGGGTVTAIADMAMSAPSNSKDTFFGFVAPPGEGIVNVTFDLANYTNLDDMAFITSAFVVVSEEASNPSPPDGGTDAPRDVVLSWTPGYYAAPVNGHKVFLGENINDVKNGIGGVFTSINSYAPGRLDFDTAYYWRVDEVNSVHPDSPWPGSVWSFTTEPVGYPIAVGSITATASSSDVGKGPENAVNGLGLDATGLLHSEVGNTMWLSDGAGAQPAWIRFEFDRVYRLNEMWVWNSNESLEKVIGLGFKDVTIEYSADGTEYVTLGTTHEFAQGPGAPGYAHNTTVDFGGVTAKYVRLTPNSNWGGFLSQYGLSEVRFFYIPVNAREPNPESGAADVSVDGILAWRPGREAARHDVYLSTDEQAVIDGTAPAAAVTDASYSPALDLTSTYYWRIDEVNDAETPTIWQGDIWSFSTPEYLVVDDFEAYNDINPGQEGSNRIFEAWIDGYGVATNGALVGYDPPQPSMEMVTVHGGKQSMPLFYSNTGGATYSEAAHTLAAPQDWTKYGIQTLVLYFHGTPGNTGQLYVKVNGVKVAYPGDAADIAKPPAKPPWQQWNIDLASLGVNLQSVTTLAIGIEGNGAGGTLYVDDIVLYRLAPPKPAEEIYIEAEAATPLGASWRVYTDPLSSGGSHIGSEDGDGNDNTTAPGAAWLATYNFNASGGTYKVLLRGQEQGSDSFWVRITTATSQTHENPGQPGTGWVMFNGLDAPNGWAWDEVHSDDHERMVVNWTLPAGPNTIEIAKREDGVWLDAILISKIDQASLPEAIP